VRQLVMALTERMIVTEGLLRHSQDLQTVVMLEGRRGNGDTHRRDGEPRGPKQLRQCSGSSSPPSAVELWGHSLSRLFAH
jgi:hypothetical protein